MKHCTCINYIIHWLAFTTRRRPMPCELGSSRTLSHRLRFTAQFDLAVSDRCPYGRPPTKKCILHRWEGESNNKLFQLTCIYILVHGNAPLYLGLREGISMVQEQQSRNSVLSLVLPIGSTFRETYRSHIGLLLLSRPTGTSYQSPFEQLKTLYIFDH